MEYKVENIIKYYGDLKVLDGVNIDFQPNNTTCILGPSGCGKTTLLNIIAGIIDEDSGQVIGFEDQYISYVFQEDRLIEWKNVKENIEFVLKGKMDKGLMEFAIDRYLKLVNLEEYKYYYPKNNQKYCSFLPFSKVSLTFFHKRYKIVFGKKAQNNCYLD